VKNDIFEKLEIVLKYGQKLRTKIKLNPFFLLYNYRIT